MSSIGTVTGLPGGGTTGQTLAKRTTADYDAGWASAATGGATPGPLCPSGQWVDNRTAASQVGGTIAISNACWWMPIYLPGPLSVAAIAAVTMNGSATATCYLGVNTINPATGLPAALLASGSVAMTAAAGLITLTLGSPVVVPAGWNWLALGVNAAGPTWASVGLQQVSTPLGARTGAGLGSGMTPLVVATSPVPVSNPAAAPPATYPASCPVVYLKAA